MWFLVQIRLREFGPTDVWVTQPLNLLSVWTRALETEWLYESTGLLISQWVEGKDLEFNGLGWSRLSSNTDLKKAVCLTGPFRQPIDHEMAAQREPVVHPRQYY